MTIYQRKSVDYRKIYRRAYGEIPKDESGRTYDIHHIDGDHTNNHPSNLRAVSIEEHYRIHAERNEWGACHLIALRMKESPELLAEAARKSALSDLDRCRKNLEKALDAVRGKKRPEHSVLIKELWKSGHFDHIIKRGSEHARYNVPHNDESKKKMRTARSKQPLICCIKCHKGSQIHPGIASCHYHNHHRKCYSE
jgi:hypothetical protein